MRDNFSELIRFSPFGGELILEQVKGTTDGNLNPENNVNTVIGADRDMYSYIPKTGCPHAKQAAVFMVLRNDPSQESAQKLIGQYALDKLAEQFHFILLFPNPVQGGWNYQQDKERDNDIDYLVRCFAALPKSKGKVAGFNGMIYYLGTDPESSAMAMTVAAVSPLDAAAIMVGRFPENYQIPQNTKAQQAAWVYEGNRQAEEYLKQVNREDLYGSEYVISRYTEEELSAQMIEKAWDEMFSQTRRWRNDTYGLYQPRIDFEAEGFVGHVNDDSLGVNNGFRHTWYEYVPEAVRNSDRKVPLVIYFHGINCTALYGAEQSGWAALAKRDNFIAVFPNPAIEERWNVWDDDRLPSDMAFVMAIIEHMKKTWPIDETRIYASGFSMGSMMTNAITCSYPEVFAAALACNGPNWGYLQTLDQAKPGLLMFNRNSVVASLESRDEPAAPTHLLADRKKEKRDYIMPFVQCTGLIDGTGFNRKGAFPLTNGEDNTWIGTIGYWLRYNHLADDVTYSEEEPSGLKSDETKPFGERFIDQCWKNEKGEDLYHFITIKRMPHAVDLREIEYGWDIIRNYVRNSGGSLSKE
ncbi:MAG: hypothetical protein II712_02055 [Erysipelotrichaceae bacterium]|nr:hypothetical protein [Erysipelotrichaceae bacterium]